MSENEPIQSSEQRSGAATARSVVAGVVAVLAVLCLTAAAVAVWARVTVLDSGKVAEIAGDALAEPEVQAALATYLTDEVFTAVDVDTVLGEVLPSGLQRLEPVLAAGARTAVDRGLTATLANPDVQELLTTVVERAHGRALRLLEGDGLVDGISVTDGEVTVNLLPLVGRGLERFQDLGLLTGVQLPELSADGDPSTQVADLESALGRTLPAGFGQLVVYRSDTVADAAASVRSAQQAFAAAERAVWILVVLAVVLLAATILLARDRWRATMLLGLGVIVAMVITRSATQRAVDEGPGLAAKPGGRAAIAAMLAGASSGLLRLAALILIVAAAAVVLALYRRRFGRSDLVLVGAVVVGAAVVAVLGVSLLSLVAGLVIGLLVPVIIGRVAPPRSSVAVPAAT